MSKYWLPAAAIGTFIGVEAWRGRKGRRGLGRRGGVRYDSAANEAWVAFFSDDRPTAEGMRLGKKFRDRIEYLVDNKFNLPDDAGYPDLDDLAFLSYASHAGHGIGLWEKREPWHRSFEKVVMADKQARDLGYRLDEEVYEGQVAAGEAGRRAKTNFKRGDHVVSIHPSAPSNYTGRVKGPSGMSSSLVRVAWDGDDAPDRTVNVKYLRHAAKGRRAKKDWVSKCISGKVRGEGWDQRQAVAACLNMDREGRLRADGSYKRNGAARGRRVPASASWRKGKVKVARSGGRVDMPEGYVLGNTVYGAYRERRGQWSVTHLPSGFSMVKTKTLADAKKFVRDVRRALPSPDYMTASGLGGEYATLNPIVQRYRKV